MKPSTEREGRWNNSQEGRSGREGNTTTAASAAPHLPIVNRPPSPPFRKVTLAVERTPFSAGPIDVEMESESHFPLLCGRRGRGGEVRETFKAARIYSSMERSEEDAQKWREQTFRPPLLLLPLSPFALCRYGERKGRGGKEGTFSPFFAARWRYSSSSPKKEPPA